MIFNELEFNVPNLLESATPKQTDNFQFEVETTHPNPSQGVN